MKDLPWDEATEVVVHFKNGQTRVARLPPGTYPDRDLVAKEVLRMRQAVGPTVEIESMHLSWTDLS